MKKSKQQKVYITDKAIKEAKLKSMSNIFLTKEMKRLAKIKNGKLILWNQKIT